MSYIALALLVLAQDSKGPRGGKIEWTKDYDAGMREALRADTPSMIYFTADW